MILSKTTIYTVSLRILTAEKTTDAKASEAIIDNGTSPGREDLNEEIQKQTIR
jgi:hypothetical protein